MEPTYILNHLDHPADLEARFREDPEAFAAAFSIAWDERPGDPVLAVWHARLDANGALVTSTRPDPTADTGWRWAETLPGERSRTLLAQTIGMALLGGLVFKIPAFIGMPESLAVEQFHARFAPFYALLPLLGVFALRYRPAPRIVAIVAALLGALLLVQAVRPIDGDVATLSIIHLPALLLSLGAALALGLRWRDVDARMDYLQFAGETAALSGVFLLGGMILTGLTAGLFSAIGVDIEEVIGGWMVPFGAIGILPVAALMASQRPGSGRIAPLVARVFGPMALVVLALYLPTLLATGALDDRDTLLILNLALLAVLALVLLLEAERPDVPRHWTDWVAAGLVTLALAADVVAFAFVAERLAEGGLTPNRLAVVGLNALVAVHLGGLAVGRWRRLLAGGPAPSDAWTARYLAVYAAWGATVVLLFPLVF